MRPGALADAFDRAQVYELNVLAELAQRALDAGVQVIVEGPGHVPLNQVAAQVQLQKELCKGVPFMCLGRLLRTLPQDMTILLPLLEGLLPCCRR